MAHVPRVLFVSVVLVATGCAPAPVPASAPPPPRARATAPASAAAGARARGCPAGLRVEVISPELLVDPDADRTDDAKKELRQWAIHEAIVPIRSKKDLARGIPHPARRVPVRISRALALRFGASRSRAPVWVHLKDGAPPVKMTVSGYWAQRTGDGAEYTEILAALVLARPTPGFRVERQWRLVPGYRSAADASGCRWVSKLGPSPRSATALQARVQAVLDRAHQAPDCAKTPCEHRRQARALPIAPGTTLYQLRLGRRPQGRKDPCADPLWERSFLLLERGGRITSVPNAHGDYLWGVLADRRGPQVVVSQRLGTVHATRRNAAGRFVEAPPRQWQIPHEEAFACLESVFPRCQPCP